MIPPLKSWLCRGGLLALSLGGQVAQTSVASAQTPAESRAMEERLAAELDGFAKDQIEAYFVSHGLPRPTSISTRTRASFRDDGGVVKVAEVDLAVDVVTDQPSPVMREVRQTVARALNASGYRLEQLEGVVDSRPLASLTLSTTEPPPEALRGNTTKEYMVFAALCALLAASLILFGKMLISPWRRKRKVQIHQMARSLAELRHEDDVIGLPDIPIGDVHEPSAVPPPPPRTEAEADSESEPDAAAAAATAEDTSEIDELKQLPFEQVLDVLIAAEPLRRKSLIERLDLSPPLRRKLEQELLT